MSTSLVIQRAVLALTLCATVVGMLPVFMVGALAPEMSRDLGIGASEVGVMTAAFFAVSAVASLPAGRLVQSRGWAHGVMVVGGMVAIAALAIGVLELGTAAVAACLLLAGVANAMSHPAANMGLVTNISPEWRGLAFGIKQAAVPIATLLAGAAVPIVGLRYGWRAGFVGLAVLASLVCLGAVLSTSLQRKRASPPRCSSPAEELDSKLLILALGAGLGSAAANTMGTFLVLYAVSLDHSPGMAGALLMVGSVANIGSRLFMGWRADRRDGGHLRTAARMMVLGAVGVVVLSAAPPAWLLVPATVIAFGVGWGWNGLLHHGTMRIYSATAARTTSVVQASLFGGAVAGPLAFGFAADALSYGAAWLLVASWLIGGALLIRWFRHAYHRSSNADLAASS